MPFALLRRSAYCIFQPHITLLMCFFQVFCCYAYNGTLQSYYHLLYYVDQHSSSAHTTTFCIFKDYQRIPSAAQPLSFVHLFRSYRIPGGIFLEGSTTNDIHLLLTTMSSHSPYFLIMFCASLYDGTTLHHILLIYIDIDGSSTL